MNTRGLFGRLRDMRIVVVLLALLLAYGTVSYTLRAASLPTSLVPLAGVTGSTNNTVLAFERYVLVAPFWPSKGVSENGELEISELDNCFIYVIDTKKPNNAPLSKELTVFDSKLGSKTIYFPSKVVFDPHTSSVYVRGTRFQQVEEEVQAIDVIAYVHLNLDDNGKPVFDNVVPIDIKGVGTTYTNEAPLDFAFGRGGLMVFTNGASMFSFNLEHGYLYEAGIVPESEYSADNSISFLDVDSETNVVTVCWNRKNTSKDSNGELRSELSFYSLNEDGTFDILKRVYADQLPEGAALASGSNVEIISDEDSALAVFATNDGSLCSVDLRSEGVLATVKRLYVFPELARASASDLSPLLVQHDSAKRVIGILKPGFTVQISRPSNGRRGRISRPSNLHINSETPPVLAMAKLNKKNKVASVHSFSEEFNGEGGLSNFVSGQDSEWLVSTYSGRLYSINVDADLKDAALSFVGLVGSRVDRIDYYSERSSVVAINSLALGQDGLRIADPGSVVVGKRSELQGQSILQALLPTASALARHIPAIRRPCNIKR